MAFLEKINKKTKTIEITTQLFDTCQNGCIFCLQNNKQKHKYSKENLAKVIESVKSLIKAEPEATTFDLILQGGELFSDNVPDSQISDYHTVIIELVDFVKSINKNIVIQANSNLINTKPLRIKSLADTLKAEGIKISIATSFDFFGRFKTKEDLALFYSNLITLREYVSIVSMVLTRENIKTLVSQEVMPIDTLSVFNLIYSAGIQIAFEIYFPDINSYKTSMPSDNDTLDFYYYSIVNYPNFAIIKNLYKPASTCNCACNHLVLAHGEKVACKHWIFDKALWANPDDSYDTHVKNFITKYRCLSCEFFKKCPLGCFYSHDFKLAVHHKTCIYKHIYHYIETKEKLYFDD